MFQSSSEDCVLTPSKQQSESSRSNEDVKALKQVAGRENSEQKYVSCYTLQLKQVYAYVSKHDTDVHLTKDTVASKQVAER